MGCAMMSEEKISPNGQQARRTHKRTQLIDCRKKSTHAQNTIMENITAVCSVLEQGQKEFAVSVLKEHNLFKMLTNSEIEEIVKFMEAASAKEGAEIFQEGDKGNCFFIIEQGQIQIKFDPHTKKTLLKGECFGEVALIYTCKRTASAANSTPPGSKLKLLFLRAKPFKEAMALIRTQNYESTRKIVDRIQIFSLLSTKQKYCIVNSLVKECYKAGQVLFEKDDISTSFYIIQSGKVSLEFNNPLKKDLILGELTSFGETAFKKQGRREGRAVVLEDLNCLTINQQKMTQILGGNLSNIVFHNIKKWALASSPIFHDMQSRDLDRIASHFQKKMGKRDDVIMKAGKPADRLIINLEGYINNQPMGTLFNDEFFTNQSEKLDKDIIKTDRGIYAELTFKKLQQAMQFIAKNRNSTTQRLDDKERKKSFLNKQNHQAINFDNLEYLMKLGEGQFGLVQLVREKRTGELFALKCLDKKKIRQENMEESAVFERDILSNICHPLIVGFYRAYEDTQNVYFLLEFILGIEMFEAIREIGVLNKVISRFYFGSLLVAVEYLHKKNIIYRDVKPENSIVNFQGKVYLIDLGTAKLLKSDNGFRTDTIIGTPHYMAPEVMQGKGYTFDSDIWSLGILFYELICGHLPFAESLDSPYAIYSEILKTPVQFPSFLTDESAKQIIKKMLNKSSPQGRRGSGEDGLSWVKQTAYFEAFRWEDLEQGRMIAPYIPRKFRNGKTHKFDEMHCMPLIDFLHQKRRPSDTVGKAKNGPVVIKEWLTQTIK